MTITKTAYKWHSAWTTFSITMLHHYTMCCYAVSHFIHYYAECRYAKCCGTLERYDLCHFISPSTNGGIWTLALRIIGRVFYRCATIVKDKILSPLQRCWDWPVLQMPLLTKATAPKETSFIFLSKHSHTNSHSLSLTQTRMLGEPLSYMSLVL